MQNGSIPSIYFSSHPQDDLKSYVGNYITEEIIAEAATRNIPAFSRFLEVAAISNGQLINYEKIANDAQVPRSTIQSYYEILRDTLIGRDLGSYRKTKSRKAILAHKFYFFDLGVVNYLKRVRNIPENSPDFGSALEAFFYHELSSYCDYFPGNELCYWRSQSGYEVDFILNEEIAIEVKATKKIDKNDLKGIQALSDELKLKHKIVVCQEPVARKIGDIEVLPVLSFLKLLWSRNLS
jgi:predicted AAA+ superfamily ATPase